MLGRIDSVIEQMNSNPGWAIGDPSISGPPSFGKAVAGIEQGDYQGLEMLEFGAVRGDPGRLLLPSALAGGLMLVVADLLARMTPTDQELKLGVFTALVGAPLFALIAWRAAREWRL